MHSVWILNIILFFKYCQGENEQSFKNYNGCQLMSITPQTSTEFNYIKKVYEKNVMGIEFWRQPIGINKTASLQICPNAKKKVILKLKKMIHKLEIDDIQKNIDEGLSEYKHLRHFDSTARTFKDLKFNKYHSLEEINKFINFAQKKYPKIMHVETIGTTVKNNSLRLIKLRKRTKNSRLKKKIFWLDSGTHAREWITIASLLYVFKQLLTSRKPSVKSLFKKFDFYILLVANPDGFKYTWTNNRLWRKNRSKAPRHKCRGVDTNRNYDVDFYGNAEVARDNISCRDNYRGFKPFSEKETQAIRDAIYGIKSDLDVFISVHSYNQMWLFPYGYTDEKPKNFNQLSLMAYKMAVAMETLYGTIYTAGTIQDLIIPVSGSAIDWVYDNTEARYVYSVELRDTGNYGFLLPQTQIIPTAKELFVAIKVLGKNWRED